MRKQYLVQIQYKNYEPEKWLNAMHRYSNFKRRYADSIEEAEKAIEFCKNEFTSKKTGALEINYCNGIGISTVVDDATKETFTVINSRIKMREVTEWEEVK